MKERAEPNEPPKPTMFKRRKWIMAKQWLKVGSGTHPNGLKQYNESIESIYHSILKTVKEQYLEPGAIYFERDYKYDFSDPFALHSFTCDQFYFYLECDFLFKMRIEYDFDNCQFENEVMKRLIYAISNGNAIHALREPNVSAYFKRVIAHQDKQFIKTL